MKKFMEPEIEIEKFNVEDVITTSGEQIVAYAANEVRFLAASYIGGIDDNQWS